MRFASEVQISGLILYFCGRHYDLIARLCESFTREMNVKKNGILPLTKFTRILFFFFLEHFSLAKLQCNFVCLIFHVSYTIKKQNKTVRINNAKMYLILPKIQRHDIAYARVVTNIKIFYQAYCKSPLPKLILIVICRVLLCIVPYTYTDRLSFGLDLTWTWDLGPLHEITHILEIFSK